MRSNFKLWPVGQGLFYTGEIKSEGKAFNFVYDCGGNESIITKMVDKYIPYSDKYIDMLVISHFDNDHINGLPLLLKKVNKINKLFIPYCGDIASYLLLVSYIYGNGSSFSNKINDIILVRTSELEEENRLIDFEELRLENVLDETYRIDNIRVSTMDTSSSSINLRAIWQFKLYNTFLKGKISVDIIKQKIDKLITEKKCTSLGELLLNHLDDIINDLKDIYKPYVSSNLRNSKHNQASLCLYHSPLVRIYNYEVGCVPKQTFKEFMEGKKLVYFGLSIDFNGKNVVLKDTISDFSIPDLEITRELKNEQSEKLRSKFLKLTNLPMKYLELLDIAFDGKRNRDFEIMTMDLFRNVYKLNAKLLGGGRKPDGLIYTDLSLESRKQVERSVTKFKSRKSKAHQVQWS